MTKKKAVKDEASERNKTLWASVEYNEDLLEDVNLAIHAMYRAVTGIDDRGVERPEKAALQRGLAALLVEAADILEATEEIYKRIYTTEPTK